MIDKRGIVFRRSLQFNDFVEIRQPTVEMAALEGNYGTYVQFLCVTTRELFSYNPREVDKIEEQFPTMWEMMFHEEMNEAIGKMFGFESADKLFLEAIAFWTKTNVQDYDYLQNSKKFIHKEFGWVITKEEFEKIREAIVMMTGHEPNEDLIAPEGISSASDRVIDMFEKTYKGRLKKAKKSSSTIDDKIIILQIANGGYIPTDEIKNMSIYHFNKLYEALNEKEAYQVQWDIYVSPKFMPKGGASPSQPTHWKSKFKS